MKTSLPAGLGEGRQGQLEHLEIEAVVQVLLQAVAPVLGWRIRRGKLPRLRGVLQELLVKRHCVSFNEANHRAALALSGKPCSSA